MSTPTPVPAPGPATPVPLADLGVEPGAVTSVLGGAPSGAGGELAARLAGLCPVDTDDAALVAGGRDWWPLSAAWAVEGRIPARPGVVARPTSAGEVAAVLALCSAERIPVTPAAGRSGVCGGAIPLYGGVALDLRGLLDEVQVDPESMLVDVGAGMWGDHLEAELRQAHGLTLGHWPQSIAMSTVGGWLACRSAGQYSTRYGKIEDMVVGLEVVLADGRIVRTGGAGPRSATGPDLTQLFVGSEGTLGVITRARFRAHPAPPYERRATWSFASFAEGLEVCRRILRRGATPAVLRLYDEVETARGFDIDEGCLLVVVDEGDPGLVDAVLAVVAEECAAGTPAAEELARRWLQRRNEVASLEDLARGGVVADTIEIAAPWSQLPSLYDDAVAALRSLAPTIAASAHQSHAYSDGACLYFTFAGVARGAEAPAWAPGALEAFYRDAWDAVSAVTLARGGSLSHHHGVGLNRGRHLATALGSGFEVLQAVKDTLDPTGILNPGKLGLASPWGPLPWPRPV